MKKNLQITLKFLVWIVSFFAIVLSVAFLDIDKVKAFILIIDNLSWLTVLKVIAILVVIVYLWPDTRRVRNER